MRKHVFLGLARHMVPIPGWVWRRAMAANARKTRAGLGFMTPDHHRVRDFAVVELARCRAPMTANSIAHSLRLSIERTHTILDELERHLTYLFRGDGEAVTWAYPVTVAETPHRAAFSTGEQAYSP
jgi:hypothetical protein